MGSATPPPPKSEHPVLRPPPVNRARSRFDQHAAHSPSARQGSRQWHQREAGQSTPVGRMRAPAEEEVCQTLHSARRRGDLEKHPEVCDIEKPTPANLRGRRRAFVSVPLAAGQAPPEAVSAIERMLAPPGPLGDTKCPLAAARRAQSSPPRGPEACGRIGPTTAQPPPHLARNPLAGRSSGGHMAGAPSGASLAPARAAPHAVPQRLRAAAAVGAELGSLVKSAAMGWGTTPPSTTAVA